MATPTVYTSNDASAPTLSGTVGALDALLYAVLVTGYGSKSGAGWTRAYTGMNKSAYRAGSGLQSYLRIDDTDAQLARLVGYRSMSDVDTGTDAFPTGAQVSGGLYFRKSTSANSSARGWFCVATNKTFYLFAHGLDAFSFIGTNGGATNFGFGELDSYVTSDAYHAFIVGATDSSTSLTNFTSAREPLGYFGTAGLSGHYLTGDYAQANGSINTWKRASNRYIQSSAGASGTGTQMPNPCTGKLELSRIISLEGSNVIRGVFPGLFSPGHPYTGSASVPPYMVFEGRGDLSGKTFYSMNNGGAWCLMVQIGGDWSW